MRAIHIFNIEYLVTMYLRIVFVLNLLHFVFSRNIVYPCTTPTGERAYCRSLFSCPHMMHLLGNLEPHSINFVKSSICLGCAVGDFIVCCGSEKNTTLKESISPHFSVQGIAEDSKEVSSQRSRNESLKLLPASKFCGYQQTDDRVYNETQTALDEFPWLVHILFTDLEAEYEFADRCSGVLISNRYVLTDAYCGAEAIKVRLGQHITNKNVSCIDDPDLPECSDPTIVIRVEERVRDGRVQNGPYDFTLLKLAEKVSFTDYVRPICLPIDESKRPARHDSLFLSGWGASGPEGIKKKRLLYDVATPEVCYRQEIGLEGNVKFANVTLICAVPQKNDSKAACNGEHGGAFMYTKKHQWFAEGIVVDASASNTPFSCSTSNSINGIRITPKTIDWILDSIHS